MTTDSHNSNARPEHIGPGYWKALHQWAYVHDTSTIKAAKEMFVDNLLRGTGAHFDCLECRAHAVEYMTKTDPIKNITSPVTVKMPCSQWVYRFHEAVNERLKKPQSQRPTFSQHEQYLSDLREGKGCGDCGAIGSHAPAAVVKEIKIRRQIID